MYEIDHVNQNKVKILFFASIFLYLLSDLFLFLIKINLNFNDLIYKISYLDVILNSGLISNSKQFIFNFFRKNIL